MNLSPDWVAAFAMHQIESVHWSKIGDPKAEDVEIIQYAHDNAYVIFTHDLDFGTILALTQAKGPSVIQVRGQDILPSHLADIIVNVMHEHRVYLHEGALITIDEARARVRILPLK